MPTARLALLFAVVVVFSTWWFWTLLSLTRFRDNLLERDYEGSLSTNLGLLVALTSEAAQSLPAPTPEAQRQHEMLTATLRAARDRLTALTALPPAPQLPAFPVEALADEDSLRRLLGDPRLSALPLDALGLRLDQRADAPAYPVVESTYQPGMLASFVFIPASGVEAADPVRALSLRRRRELVFSKLAEPGLQDILSVAPAGAQAYYISCSDFIRLVPFARVVFPQFRSFVDRTYFAESRRRGGQVRESSPYLSGAGGGFVKTYSAFVDNPGLGLCGMLAIDVELARMKEVLAKVGFGTAAAGLKDFKFATYSLDSRQIETTDRIGDDVRASVAQRLQVPDAAVFRQGIQRWSVGGATIFSVPQGDGKLALFVFDRRVVRAKYLIILMLGVSFIAGFVWMVATTSREQRAAEAADRLLREIVEKLHGGFLIVGGDGVVGSASQRFRQMVGTAQVEGRAVGEFLAEESGVEYRRRSAESGEFQFAGNLASHEPVIIASASLAELGDARMLIVIPAGDLEQAIAKKFLNIFSHALKSPAHGILLMVDLFRRKKAQRRIDEYWPQLHRKVQEFRTLTDNVLRFSALDVKDIQSHLVPVDADQLLRQALAAAGAHAHAKGLRLDAENIHTNLRVRADAELLQIVFNNLIDNALKYTPSGRIVVRAEGDRAAVSIIVEDTGLGIPEVERPRIFDLFFQGSHPSVTSNQGLGLGLYISRRYVEAMGGTLVYEPVLASKASATGGEALQGSRFIVQLPAL